MYSPSIYLYLLYLIKRGSNKDENFKKITKFSDFNIDGIPKYEVMCHFLKLVDRVGLKFYKLEFQENPKDENAGLEGLCFLLANDATKDKNYLSGLEVDTLNNKKVYNCSDFNFLKQTLFKIRKEKPEKWLREYVLNEKAWKDKYFCFYCMGHRRK